MGSSKQNSSTSSHGATVRSKPQIELRPFATAEEYLQCVTLQQETWGHHFGDIVPASVLKISQKVGGISAGAFDENRNLLGFVYGITGVKNGELVHWSHMLAVSKTARESGIGRRLKLYQRDRLLELGVRVVYWTFDPLVARNAKLNLNSLGAEISEYVENMYVDSSSDLHRGLGMDRFIVAWNLDSERVLQAVQGKPLTDTARFLNAPVVNTKREKGALPVPVDSEFSDSDVVRVEVPRDVEAIQASSLQLASQWRGNTRRVFLWYLKKGYTVEEFYIDPENDGCYYCLEFRKQAR